MTTSINTILVVDDNEAHRYFVCRTLEEAGFKTVSVANGSAALEQVNNKPDLVLLDLHLPDINGLEVCRRLKAQNETRSIPVVMFSSVSQGGDAVNSAHQLGAAGFLFFPIAPEHLVSVVEGQLKKSKDSNPPKVGS